MRVQLGCALIGLVWVGCTQSPVARPPVVDASWRATAQDRVQPSTPRQSEVAPPPVRGIDPAREQ